jgi:tripartite-type tricarboxylate transporter receptor subunit TctC
MNRRHFLGLGAATVSLVSAGVWSQTYPARPVRVIVTFAPGGPTDVAAA